MTHPGRDIKIYLKGHSKEFPLRAHDVDAYDNFLVVTWFEGDHEKEIIPMHRVISVIGPFEDAQEF